jgi:hypothetical protein
MVTTRSWVRWSASLAAAACVAGSASAQDQMTCRNSIVRVGMTSSEIAAKCGEPKDKSVENVPVRATNARRGTTNVTGSVTVERWTYDRGSGRFPALLTFEDGKLKSIEMLTDR